MTDAFPPEDHVGPERLFVITGGRVGSHGSQLDLVTLVVARSTPQPGMSPENRHILSMCRTPLSVAEISAYLSLPVSAVTVLLADLLVEHQVEARSPVSRAVLPDLQLLKEVMYGLQKL